MTEDLLVRVEQAFAAGGSLSAADPHYEMRTGQLEMASAVAQALLDRAPLVAEAGTGVGKTFAYLVPLLFSGRRALVSTATKSLQDQLFLRDLPRLIDTLAVPVHTALLKGRSSYLCRHRLVQARHTAQLPDRFAVRALARVEAWAQGTRSGDLAEIEGLDDRSPVIPLVTSTRDNCLGAECPAFAACHVVQARREAMAADLVVVNHHLFFADMALRDSGVAELLPTVDAVVFDEAHQLVDAGVQFLGTTLGTAQVLDYTRDLLAVGTSQARGLAAWHDLAGAVETAARRLRLACSGGGSELRGTRKLRWDERATDPDLVASLSALHEAAATVGDAIDALATSSPDLLRLAQRARELSGKAEVFAREVEPGRVRWIDAGAQQARLVDSPLDIRELLADQRRTESRAWVFTSATLGDDDALSWFTDSTGLEDARKLRVPSPFDYASHARVWVPARLPRPNEPSHPEAVGALAARLAQALGGRTFVLTTTLRALERVARSCRDQSARAGAGLTVLVQGEQPRRALLRAFGEGEGRVLVGSQSFWEGIDVPGDALQCVVIDKLPFPPPNDPLVEARVKALEHEGRNAFTAYFVAEAAVSLKQGAGRLIRTETDRGLLVIADPRMRQMGYGSRLLAALPPMRPVDDEAEALAWLDTLAADRHPW